VVMDEGSEAIATAVSTRHHVGIHVVETEVGTQVCHHVSIRGGSSGCRNQPFIMQQQGWEAMR
jgi:hypothetical protein